MATIPMFVSKRDPTSEPGAVTRHAENTVVKADPNMIDNQAGEEAGKMLADFGEKMRQVANANADAKTKVQVMSERLAYEDAINKSPDPEHALDDYDKVNQDITDRALKNYSDPVAKAKAKQDLDYENLIFKNKLQTVVYKKQVDVGRANVLTEMDMQLSDYINANTDEEKLKARQVISGTMKKAQGLQLFGAEEGDNALEKVIDSGDKAREDAKDLKKRKEKEIQLAQKEASNASENEYVKMKLTHKDKNGIPITNEELLRMVEKDLTSEKPSISPKFADAYTRAIKSPKAVGAKTSDPDFSNILTGIREDVDPTAIRTKIENDHADGKLSEEDYGRAVSFLEETSTKNVDDLVARRKKDGWKGLLHWSDNNLSNTQNKALAEESRARMGRIYLDKLREGIDPETAALDATRLEVLHIMANTTIPEQGLEVIDAKGIRKTVMPNGDLVTSDKKPKPSKEKK